MSDWQPLGKHRIRVGGDVIFWEVHGVTQLDEMQRFYELAEAVLSQHVWVALSVDLRDASIPSAEARRYMADWERKHPERRGVVIFYGASVPLRSIGSLIQRGIAMLLPKRNSQVFWVANEADALATIASQRPR